MSGNLSTYAGGGSRWISDPRQLPVYQLAETNLYTKTGLATSTNCSAANASTFFGSVALRGAQASVAVADTFVTLATLSGRGRLYNVIPPTNTGAVYTPTLELTIDGTVYTIAPSTTLAATNRMVLGACTALPATNVGATVGTDIMGPNAYTDPGYQSAAVGGFFTLSPLGIIVPEMMETYNMPYLQFESSCVIKFKTSLLASAAGDRIGGASYRMLP